MNTIREQWAKDHIFFRKPALSATAIGATRTLREDESGVLFVLDRAAGCVITLPTAPHAGVFFDFMVATSVTSNSYKVITGVGTELLVGGIISDDTDSTDAIANFKANGSTHIALTMAGSTTGGLVGTRLRFTNISPTQWMVEGIVNGSGVVATPFATS